MKNLLHKVEHEERIKKMVHFNNDAIEKITIKPEKLKCEAHLTPDGGIEFEHYSSNIYVIHAYVTCLPLSAIPVELGRDISYENALYILCNNLSRWGTIPYEKIQVEYFSEELYNSYIKDRETWCMSENIDYKPVRINMLCESFNTIYNLVHNFPNLPRERIYRDIVPELLNDLGMLRLHTLFENYVTEYKRDKTCNNFSVDNIGC